MKAAILERDVMKQVADVLRLYGLAGDIIRQNTGGMRSPTGRYVAFGRAGASDMAGPLPDGRYCAIECKRPGKRPTAKQYAVLRRINELGGVGLWVTDGPSLAKALDRILAGWHAEIDESGDCFVTDEPRIPHETRDSA
jgi:hypothetical protein